MSYFELNWDNDPQPHRDRYFRSKADRDAVLALVTKYEAEGELLGAGRHRAGFLVGGMIIKVGLSDGGIAACIDEVAAYDNERFTYPVAECCQLDAYSELMEPITRLTRTEAEDVRDSWRNLGMRVGSIDEDSRGYQIGITADGRHVVFDFGDATDSEECEGDEYVSSSYHSVCDYCCANRSDGCSCNDSSGDSSSASSDSGSNRSSEASSDESDSLSAPASSPCTCSACVRTAAERPALVQGRGILRTAPGTYNVRTSVQTDGIGFQDWLRTFNDQYDALVKRIPL